MTIANALGRGIHSVNRRKPLWFWFFGVTTLWALAIVAPVMAALYLVLGGSAWTGRMAANFDLQLLGEMLFSKSVLAMGPMLAAMIAAALLAGVSHLFLTGGALQLFWSEEAFSTARFFQGCGKHFWRFVRLALVCGLLCVLVAIANSLLSRAGNKIWGEGSEETPLVYWNWFRVSVVLLLFGFVNLISDYGRIRMVATDSRKAFRAALASIRFVLGNLWKTAGLYAAICIILLALLAIYRGAGGVIGQSTLGLALLLFMVRQAMALARIWTQLLFYASETEMYRLLDVGQASACGGLQPAPVLTSDAAEDPPLPQAQPEPEPHSPAPEPLQS